MGVTVGSTFVVGCIYFEYFYGRVLVFVTVYSTFMGGCIFLEDIYLWRDYLEDIYG